MDTSACDLTECIDYCNTTEDNEMQNALDTPMPWIGVYIAVASLICTLGMVGDAFLGLRRKKLWFPSKYFSINATSLTLLAIAVKLPMDLTTILLGYRDMLARLSSLVFLSVSMSNFMTSLGSIGDKEILLNLTALSIMVITVVVDVCVRNFQLGHFLYDVAVLGEEIAACVIILLLLATLTSSAIALTTTNKYLESKYHEVHKIISSEEYSEGDELRSDKLRLLVKKYWLMAETGSPQFVLARSVAGPASGMMCFLVVLNLVEAQIRMIQRPQSFFPTKSSYKWSINWIFFIQYVGIIVGTIPPVFRWFIAMSFKCSRRDCFSFKSALKVEAYWTQRLVDWRESSLPSNIRHQKCRKLLHTAKSVTMNLCVGLQVVIVVANKLILLLSVACAYPFLLLFHYIKKSNIYNLMASNNQRRSNSSTDSDPDLGLYVMVLPGEVELPWNTVKGVRKEVDKVIQQGKMQQPNNLIDLLHKFNKFEGVKEFDNNQVTSLHTQEPPSCWSLPVVTLTSIAISLSSMTNQDADQLVRSVSEGLSLVTLIEKSLDADGALVNIRKAADIVWTGVEFDRKWLDQDLKKTGLQGKTAKKVLQDLSDVAKKFVLDFKRGTNDLLMENPVNWPGKIIAANSMYRVSQTILLGCNGNTSPEDDGLFDRLSVMIADILAACLTNLSRVTTMKCYQHASKDREESVHQAAMLLGETEAILEILQQHDIPSLEAHKSAHIEGWRNFLVQDNVNFEAPIFASTNEEVSPQSGGDHVAEIDG